METSDGRKSATRNGETSQLATVSASIIPSDSLLVDKELPLGISFDFARQAYRQGGRTGHEERSDD